jgi:hypothetical protein
MHCAKITEDAGGPAPFLFLPHEGAAQGEGGELVYWQAY